MDEDDARRFEPGRELGGDDVTGDERAKVKRREAGDSVQGWGGEESSRMRRSL